MALYWFLKYQQFSMLQTVKIQIYLTILGRYLNKVIQHFLERSGNAMWDLDLYTQFFNKIFSFFSLFVLQIMNRQKESCLEIVAATSATQICFSKNQEAYWSSACLSPVHMVKFSSGDDLPVNELQLNCTKWITNITLDATSLNKF
jgi:hypothetical protein